MRARLLPALLFASSCQNEAAPLRSVAETPKHAPEPATAAEAPPPAAQPVACVETWPSDKEARPEMGLSDAVAVCIGDRSFSGAPLRELLQALGRSLSEGQKPKCAMGYPSLTFVTHEGRHTQMTFCGNVGAKEGYFYSDGLKLTVEKPEAVDDWLRRNGLLSR